MTVTEIQHSTHYKYVRLRGGEYDYRRQMRHSLSKRAYKRWLGKRKAYLRTPIMQLVQARIEKVKQRMMADMELTLFGALDLVP